MPLFTKVTPDDLPRVAAAVVAAAEHSRLVVFYGQMGAGKTTLIKAICAHLQVQEEVSSPTYALVNEYGTADGNTVYHFDFYRIRNLEEVYDMGYEDYFYSGNRCLIEWPERIPELLAGEALVTVHIDITEDGTRSINIQHQPA